MSIVTETYGTRKQILINQDSATRIGCLVSKTGVVINSEGKYIVKAGTPLYGTDVGMNRETPLTISGSTPQGILYTDVEFESSEATTANGCLVIDGTVDYLKLDSDVQSLVDSAKSSLVNIHFVKGRED